MRALPPSRPRRAGRGAWAVVRAQVRAAFLAKLQYRADFFVDALLELFWTGSAIAPLFVVYRDRTTVAGASFGEALAVVGVFTILTGVLETAVTPSLNRLVEHVRKGTLDFVLLAPRDAQLLLSTERIEPWRSANLIAGIALVVAGLARDGIHPSPTQVASALVAFAGAVVYLFAIFTVAASLAFWVVRADNLVYLFTSLFDGARWPRHVFKGFVRVLFTYVLPFAVMTNFPVEALTGKLSLLSLGIATAGACAAFVASRALFQYALRNYTSAGG